MIVERAGLADADAVRALTRAAYAKWVTVIGREPKPMQADYRRALREHRIDVIRAGDGLLALIETIPRPDHLLIENLAVREDCQGQGLATRLIEHAGGLARHYGLGELRLYTNAAFAANLAFYRARGFVESGREPLAAGGIMVHFARPVS